MSNEHHSSCDGVTPSVAPVRATPMGPREFRQKSPFQVTRWATARSYGAPRLGLCCFMLASLLQGCLQRREHDERASQNPCTQCHGSDATGTDANTDALVASAPGLDLKGNRSTRYPGVGAHAVHLLESSTHAGVSCEQCHIVPERSDAKGHYDDPPPAELVFGELAARTGAPPPRYDRNAQTCSNTYCHGKNSGVWTFPRTPQEACGSCHGLPPTWPHPLAEDCSQCHGEVVDDERNFIDPALHVDGVVQSNEPGCGACHGDGDDPAPPPDLAGQREPSARGVGAHSVHLEGGASGRPLACEECHSVPTEVAEPGHLDGEGVQVRFAFGAQASAGTLDRARWEPETATCQGSWCHGPTLADNASPAWTEAVPLECDSCHGMPPAAPHPLVENCGLCHAPVAGVTPAGRPVIAERALHVDGLVQVNDATQGACSSCHGEGDLGAPPRDTLGNEATTARGVGAHRAHLADNGRARPLACEECHAVPATVDSSGHIDTALPAEVTLLGVARAFGAEPSYEAGRCANTFCHGGSFVGGRPSGGEHVTPDWTRVDGSQRTCTSCHGMPPPAPHPEGNTCSDCHKNIADGGEFTHPERHVDGQVTFFLTREDAADAAR